MNKEKNNWANDVMNWLLYGNKKGDILNPKNEPMPNLGRYLPKIKPLKISKKIK